jgi:hypothetical protein
VEDGAEMAKKSFPLSKVYGLLEPGPVVMVTTVRKGRPNIMTMSWHTMIEFELREHLRGKNRQVRDLWSHAGGRRSSEGAAHRRVLCESRMQGRRYQDDGQVLPFYP